jgi:hypothetical protein
MVLGLFITSTSVAEMLPVLLVVLQHVCLVLELDYYSVKFLSWMMQRNREFYRWCPARLCTFTKGWVVQALAHSMWVLKPLIRGCVF